MSIYISITSKQLVVIIVVVIDDMVMMMMMMMMMMTMVVDLGHPEPGRMMTCGNGQRVPSSHRCLFEFDQYDQQIGCRDMTHIQGCGRYIKYMHIFLNIIHEYGHTWSI